MKKIYKYLPKRYIVVNINITMTLSRSRTFKNTHIDLFYKLNKKTINKIFINKYKF